MIYVIENGDKSDILLVVIGGIKEHIDSNIDHNISWFIRLGPRREETRRPVALEESLCRAVRLTYTLEPILPRLIHSKMGFIPDFNRAQLRSVKDGAKHDIYSSIQFFGIRKIVQEDETTYENQ